MKSRGKSHITRNLFFALFLLGLTSPQSHAGSDDDRTYITCHSISSSGEEIWEWARTRDGAFKVVSGFWLRDQNGDDQFLSISDSDEELKNICIETVKATPLMSLNEFVYFSAGNYFFDHDYPVRFIPKNIPKLLSEISVSLRDLSDDWFLPLLEHGLKYKKETHLLSKLLMKYLFHNPEQRKKVISYLENGKRYGNPISFHSSDLLVQVEEFIYAFRNKSDYDILRHSFGSNGQGVSRGILNSYVDLVLDAFQENTSKQTNLDFYLYNPKDREHQLINAMLQSSNMMSALQNEINRMGRLVGGSADDYEASYFSYLRMAKMTLKSLQDLKPFMEKQEGLDFLELLILQLEKSLVEELT